MTEACTRWAVACVRKLSAHSSFQSHSDVVQKAGVRIMKNTLLLAAVVAAAGIGLGASADASAASTRASKNDCVFTRSVHDFRPLDRSHMVLWGPGRKAYLVQIGRASCRESVEIAWVD